LKRCSQCGGVIARARKEIVRSVRDTTYTVRAPAHVCQSCRDVTFEDEVLTRADLEIACAIVARARPSGEALRFLRKSIGMRAADLASLLSVTPETVSRWENDQRAVDSNAWVLTGSLVLERYGRNMSTLSRLEALQKLAPLPRNVTLELDAG